MYGVAMVRTCVRTLFKVAGTWDLTIGQTNEPIAPWKNSTVRAPEFKIAMTHPGTSGLEQTTLDNSKCTAQPTFLTLPGHGYCLELDAMGSPSKLTARSMKGLLATEANRAAVPKFMVMPPFHVPNDHCALQCVARCPSWKLNVVSPAHIASGLIVCIVKLRPATTVFWQHSFQMSTSPKSGTCTFRGVIGPPGCKKHNSRSLIICAIF
mmetsp:Transcript_110718/g.352665  ORF Transcript_110718/g.352665 Transcript_110718/m.352665 type:complete len:209 (+) Transcript_110718:2550-3176(+)